MATRTIQLQTNTTPIDFTFDTEETSITIPEGATEVSLTDLYRNTKVTSITIPSSVTKISNNLLLSVNSLTEINVDKSNSNYASVDGILYDKDITRLISCPASKSGSIKVPDSVVSIDIEAFYQCANLTEIILSNHLTEIQPYAFNGCESLTSIEIPNSVPSIGAYVFKKCTNLKNVKISGKLTSIEEFAFCDSPHLTIHCYPDSPAEQYAIETNRSYKYITQELPKTAEQYAESFAKNVLGYEPTSATQESTNPTSQKTSIFSNN